MHYKNIESNKSKMNDCGGQTQRLLLPFVAEVDWRLHLFSYQGNKPYQWRIPITTAWLSLICQPRRCLSFLTANAIMTWLKLKKKTKVGIPFDVIKVSISMHFFIILLRRESQQLIFSYFWLSLNEFLIIQAKCNHKKEIVFFLRKKRY